MNKRGVVLLNVIIMMLVMIMVAATMMSLSMGRYTTIRQHKDSYEAKMAAQSIMLTLQACLSGQVNAAGVPANVCAMSTPYLTLGNWAASAGGCKTISGTSTPVTGGETHDVTATWCGVDANNNMRLYVCYDSTSCP